MWPFKSVAAVEDQDDDPRSEGRFPRIEDVDRLARILCVHYGFRPDFSVGFQSGMSTKAAWRAMETIPGERCEDFRRGRQYPLWTRYREEAEELLIQRAAMVEFDGGSNA